MCPPPPPTLPSFALPPAPSEMHQREREREREHATDSPCRNRTFSVCLKREKGRVWRKKGRKKRREKKEKSEPRLVIIFFFFSLVPLLRTLDSRNPKNPPSLPYSLQRRSKQQQRPRHLPGKRASRRHLFKSNPSSSCRPRRRSSAVSASLRVSCGPGRISEGIRDRGAREGRVRKG